MVQCESSMPTVKNTPQVVQAITDLRDDVAILDDKISELSSRLMCVRTQVPNKPADQPKDGNLVPLAEDISAAAIRLRRLKDCVDDILETLEI